MQDTLAANKTVRQAELLISLGFSAGIAAAET
jgi:hypothetical protein